METLDNEKAVKYLEDRFKFSEIDKNNALLDDILANS